MKLIDLPDLRELVPGVDEDKTPIPNDFTDFIMPRMSGIEICLMHYFFRHAWRIGRPVAIVSMSQIRFGSRTREGEWIDNGSGVKSTSSVCASIARLEERGLITRLQTVLADGSTGVNGYALHCYPYEAGDVSELTELADPLFIPLRTKHRRGGTFSSKRAWEAIKAAHNYTCVDCGRQEPEISLTRDHIIPVSKGGPNVASNIAPRCRSCNSRKNNRVLVPIPEA